MARVTVEDCLQYVDNRFQLVLVAAKRARQLEEDSAEPCVDREHDKPTVVALREIAGGFITSAILDDTAPPSYDADEDNSVHVAGFDAPPAGEPVPEA